MRFYETHYDEYIQSVGRYNLHPELDSLHSEVEKLGDIDNILFYGPPGVGKYSQVLWFLRPYSPSALKYDKRMTVQTEKLYYTYRISDIHYEIDMALLGCNAKLLWHEIFQQIVDIVAVKEIKVGVVVCKNMHMIHSELLDLFYSYVQQYNHPTSLIHLKLIIITEHVSFLPTSLQESFRWVSVKRPTKIQYLEKLDHDVVKERTPSQALQIRQHVESLDVNHLLNGKEIGTLGYVETTPPPDAFNLVCDALIEHMRDPTKVDFGEFRDAIYDILIYNLDVQECVWYILSYWIEQQVWSVERVRYALDKLAVYLRYYNNNYRPIFHLESMFFMMILGIGSGEPTT